MTTEEQLTDLEDRFHAEMQELRPVLLDIRTFLMQAQSPLPARVEMRKSNQAGPEGGQYAGG